MTARVPDLLRARAAEAPAHVALVVDGGESLTYGEWDGRADAAASGLASSGVRPGDRVALFFDNAHWAAYAACYVATLRAGAVAVPLSPRFAASELEAVLRHAEVTAVACPPDLAPPVEGWTTLHPSRFEEGDAVGVAVDLADTDLAEIVYTSGTTGRPKGVAVPHANLAAHDLPEGDGRAVSFLHAFPVGTNAGQECVRMPLRRRATAVVLPTFDPDRLCAAVAERRIERLQLVPSMAHLLVESGAPGRHDMSSVERVILSSAPAPPALWERLAAAFPNASLWNAYALTEGGGARTLMRHDPSRPTSVGRPVGATEVRVVDDGGLDVAPGETGEVWLRRRGGGRREYYRDPDATAEAFAGNWLRTGDLGYLDTDGYLHLVDRKKDVIITGGLNVSSLEVEGALAAHPAVVEAAVVGVPHAVLGQDVAAAVVARAPVDVRDLQGFVRERLGEHKVPRRVLLVDALPRNESGKVLKGELRERLGRRPEGEASAGPRTALEAAVAAVWQEVLDRPGVGVHDDFFDLGGHSLAAAQVVARLQDAFDVDIPVTAVFDRPTVAELADALSEALAEAGAR